MIHHISITAQNPLHVVTVLAEVWHGKVFNVIFESVEMAEDFKQKMEIVFDQHLPQWNYTAKPQSA